jgi:alpha-L-fucosidase 2
MVKRSSIVCAIALSAACTRTPEPELKLWFDMPATYFEESFVLGNGRLGATVYGGIESDRIDLNDITLLSGGPVAEHVNPEAYKLLPAIREALANEDYRLADQLTRRRQGTFCQSYEPVGTMHIDFRHGSETQEYCRELDLDRAISVTRYTVDGVKYVREYFVSYPDQAAVVKITADRAGALDFDVRFETPLRHVTTAYNQMIEANGYAPCHSEPSYRKVDEPVRFASAQGTRFTSLVQVKVDEGNVMANDTTLTVRGATRAVVYASIGTSFNGFDHDPVNDGADHRQLAVDRMNGAFGNTYTAMKKKHIADHQSFFRRVSLALGDVPVSKLPTDQRLKRYTEGADDPALEALYFQYGRYLLIASSRTPGVPANLQGLWNPYLRPPWSCNYTTNVNLEENYWLAESTNLAEMHQPLMTFLENLAQTGETTAHDYYGTRGWAAGHNSDIWAMSNPAGDFGWGNPVWAEWGMGGVWLATHLWEHFSYGRDTVFLRERGYPVMKGAARFCLDYLVEGPDGTLITSPSTSPECNYLLPDGYKGSVSYGATSDLALMRELFAHVIASCEILGIDPEFAAETRTALDRLHPYKIGAEGNLQEWYHDWATAEPAHRHTSHLIGLYPGNHISPAATPELAEACRRTLELRGDDATGWAMGWRINLWARLGDGNHAYRMYRRLLQFVPPDGAQIEGFKFVGGTYPNLFDAHPPFQIDGNFGAAAGVAEMLMQSNDREIRLLPALPDVWAQGTVSGLCARGGFEVSFAWRNHELRQVEVFSKTGGKTQLICGGSSREILLRPGERRKIDW